MESTISFLGFFSGKEFAVPLWEVVLLVLLNSGCLLLGRHKLGLVISYLFVFYWGFIFNRGTFTDLFGNTTWGLYLYAISGLGMALIAVFGFFIKAKQ
jgi:hypothetical protein